MEITGFLGHHKRRLFRFLFSQVLGFQQLLGLPSFFPGILDSDRKKKFFAHKEFGRENHFLSRLSANFQLFRSINCIYTQQVQFFISIFLIC